VTIVGPTTNATNLNINGLTVTYNSNTFNNSSNVGGAAIGGYNANGFGVLGRSGPGIGVIGVANVGGGYGVGGYAHSTADSFSVAGYFLNQSNGIGVRAASVSGRPFVVANATVDIMTVISNGNIGIGDSSPAVRLVVNGSINATSINAASYTVGTSFTANSTLVNVVSLSVSTNTSTFGTAARIVANGNIGIGTATPNSLVTIVGPAANATNLDINGLTVTYNSNTFTNSVNTGAAAIGGYNANGFGVLGKSGAGIGVIGVANVGGGQGVAGYAHSTADSSSIAGYFFNQSNGTGVYARSFGGRPFVAASNTAEYMSISANGNIGIGDSTPAVRLVVNGSINATSINAVSHTVGTSFTANSTLVNAVSLVVSTNTSTFGTAARIVANGNIGVGTATPGEKITVISTDSTGAAGFQTLSGTATALGAAANAGVGAYIQSRTGRPLVVANNTTEFFQVVANGNVGVGTATPNSLVTIVGPTANATNLDINGLTVTYNSNTFTSSSNVGGAAIGGYNANGFAVLGRSSAGIGIVGVANSGSGIAIAGYAHATTNSSAHAGFFLNSSNGIGVRAAVSTGGRPFVASNATVEFMSVEANGNIGFGNSSPRSKLHITRSSGASAAGEIYLDEGLYWSMLNSRSTVGAWNPLVQTNDHTLIYSDGSADTGALVIGPWSSDNKGMRIASNGSIGIGTATPGERITVISADGRGAGFFLSNTGNGLSSKTENGFAGIIGVSNSSSSSVAIAGYANTGYGGYFQTFFGTQTALAAVANAGVAVYAQSGTGRPLVVANNTVEFMSVQANGAVLFAGTHHNISSLGGVFRTGAGDYGVRIYPGGGSDSNTAILQFTNAAQNTQTAQIAVNSAGLFVGTSVSTSVYFVAGGSVKATLDPSGNFVANGNITAFGATSDERLKENITPFSNTLDKVKRLQGVTYNWKKGTAERDFAGINNDIGLIAQNVQEVFPDLVRESEDGYLSLRDRGLFAILIEAIKEQQNQIDELKKMLENK
jgi:hypothetical protein